MEQQGTSWIQNVYFYIQERVNTDWTTDPVMAIVLSIVTCGIYGLYIFYKLIERRDLHFARIANLVNSSVPLLKEKAAALGKSDLVAGEIRELEMAQAEIYEQSRERGATLWLIIAILTSFIGQVIGYYFLMDDFKKHEEYESRYFTLMSQAMAKMGLSAQASQAGPVIPDREFVMYLIFTIITCGIYGIYWMYVMVKDGNEHVEAQVKWEDFIYQTLSAA